MKTDLSKTQDPNGAQPHIALTEPLPGAANAGAGYIWYPAFTPVGAASFTGAMTINQSRTLLLGGSADAI